MNLRFLKADGFPALSITDEAWEDAPLKPVIAKHEVHLWKLELNLSDSTLDELKQTLSFDELARVNRLRSVEIARRFIAARGTLRTILSWYLEQEPQQISFYYNTRGKPALLPHPGSKRLSFNLSHSHELALFAITSGPKIGIDLEYLNPDLDTPMIARQFFSAGEQKALENLPEPQRIRTFFKYWTSKEAYLKASEQDLELSLEQFPELIKPGETCKIALVSPGQGCWQLMNFAIGSDYLASVVGNHTLISNVSQHSAQLVDPTC